MNFTILTPSDTPLRDGEDKSAATDSNFGGHRQHSQVSDAKDYTGRTQAAPNKKENPEDTTKDIDDMSNTESKKSEFSYQENKSDATKNNEQDFITESDSGNRPRMDEGSDAVQVPEATDRKQNKKANRWQYDSSDRYEGEIS